MFSISVKSNTLCKVQSAQFHFYGIYVGRLGNNLCFEIPEREQKWKVSLDQIQETFYCDVLRLPVLVMV